jgi:hypothetical protein
MAEFDDDAALVRFEDDLRLRLAHIVPPEGGAETSKRAQMAKSARRRCTVTRTRSPSPVTIRSVDRWLHKKPRPETGFGIKSTFFHPGHSAVAFPEPTSD